MPKRVREARRLRRQRRGAVRRLIAEGRRKRPESGA
jgi:hypothetical protein